jgi:hypothetical protein
MNNPLNMLLLLLLIASNQVHSQKSIKALSAEDVLKMFETADSPFSVADKIYNKVLDEKGIYNNSKLKPYLMKLLNKEAQYFYSFNKRIQEYKTQEKFKKAIKNDIFYFLRKRKRENELDSILNHEALYKVYLDSVLHKMILREEKNREEGIKKTYPSESSIVLHTRIAYPESYQIIKQYSKEQSLPGKMTYFMNLLHMGDPEAKARFDRIVKKFVVTNGKSYNPIEMFSLLEGIQNSYAIKKMIEVLDVTFPFSWFPDDSPNRPYNCEVMKILIESIFSEPIKIDSSIEENRPCNTQLKNRKKILEAAQELIKKYDERDEYWVKNLKYIAE